MPTITVADLFDELEVDLWGQVFRVREGTRTVAAKLAEIGERLEAIPETAHDDLAGAHAEILGVLLEPIPEEGTSGRPPSAKAILLKKWKADELGLDRLMILATRMQEAAADRWRPTSAQENGK